MINHVKSFRMITLLLSCMLGGVVEATPFKNIYVALEVAQTGQGTVYLKVPSDEHPQQSNTAENVELKATIGENGSDNYECELHAIPETGYDFVAFARKNATGVYTESDYIGTDNPLKVNVNNDYQIVGQDNYDEVHGRDDWSATPDHEFVAIFKEQDTSVNNVIVDYYQPLFSGEQDNTFGTWSSELINSGSQVRLTAIPAAGMRFVCWHNATGESVSTESVYEVSNTNATYKPEFNLLPITLPAELCTYSNSKQQRYDDWNMEGLEAYKVTAVGSQLTLVKVKHANAGEGVILKGAASQEYEMSYQGLFLGEENSNSDNLLQGTASGTAVSDGTFFVLADGNHGIGFYRLKSGQIVPQNKAYLQIPDPSRSFVALENSDEVTAISRMVNDKKAVMRFNMAGQRVSADYKGLVLENGRKIIMK